MQFFSTTTQENEVCRPKSGINLYPFGAPMPGRGYQASEYKYGFGSHEKDNEISGEGNSYTAEYWQYDSRLGRRWNIDPKPRIGLSDYSVFGNNPIVNIDPDGAYFFGLIGSTSEQRRTARDFAAATGGTVKNITSKNVSVDWWTQESKKNSDGEFQLTATKHSINFLRGGGLDFGDDMTNFLMRGQYESSLKMGDYNIYTGYPKGSGALAAPTIDPIDILAGGLSGFAQKGFAQSAGKGVTQNEIANFSETILAHMNNPKRYVPATLLDDVAKNTKAFPDPQGTAATMHYSTMLKNGKAYNLEVLFDQSTNTILHFKYTQKAIGTLPAITK